MKKTYQYIFGASLALAAFSFIPDTFAQTCATPPTCESLGYEFTTADCADRPSLKCPFDTSKIYCLTKKEASEAGICMNVGDILYSDKTCSSPDNLVKGKTAIAVVVDPKINLAMGLDIQKELVWAEEKVQIPGLTSYGQAPLNDFSGKYNTKIIVDYCKANQISCPAAEFAYNYSTPGTKPGDWHLPAAGELQATQVYNIIETSLDKVGGYYSNELWSSSQMSKDDAWMIIRDGPGRVGIVNYFKQAKEPVTPFIYY